MLPTQEVKLPELEITAEDCREQAENPKPTVAALRCRERQLLTALASLAQSEAERNGHIKHTEYLQYELNAVLSREYATTVRYDAKIDKLEVESKPVVTTE